MGIQSHARELERELAAATQKIAWLEAVPPADHPDDERHFAMAFVKEKEFNQDLLRVVEFFVNLEKRHHCSQDGCKVTSYVGFASVLIAKSRAKVVPSTNT